MAGATISAEVKLDGGKSFKEQLKESALAVKAANTELAYFSAELKKNGNSQDALRGKIDAQNKAFEQEQKVIDLLTRQIEELATTEGQDATAEIDRLTAELYKHKTAQAQLGDQVDDTTDDFSEFATQVGLSSAIFNKLTDLATAAARKIWDIGKGAVEYNAQIEGYQKTIEAFFKTSGMTADEATKSTKELIDNQKELSTQVGIGTDKLIEANKMLIASGVSGEDSQKAIEGLAKAIVATGGGNEELSRMAQNLQQISNTGKASSQDLKQFAMAGVDVYGLLADTTGKTVEELKDMDITFDMISDALSTATSEGGKFFEASQVGAQTLNGQISGLKTEISEGLGTAFEPVNTALEEDFLPLARELVENIDWESIGEGIANGITALTELMRKIDEVVAWIEEQQMAEKGKEFVDDFANGMHNNNGAMNVAAAYLMDSFYADVAEEKAQATLAGADITDSMASGMVSGKSGVIGAAEEVQMSAFAVWNENNQSEQYGMDFVAGFANGMHKNNGLIANAAAQIAQTIKEWLHFSHPDVGPLKDYEKWMPDFVAGLAKGIEDSEWMLADASQDLAQTITNNTTTNNINMSVYGTAGQSAADIADMVMLRIQQATDRRTAVWA